ncbi:MAG: hypothetical protein KF764_28850 [Labilithrix sp.]|nr:hypothetical protein [Labilithrix sp.]
MDPSAHGSRGRRGRANAGPEERNEKMIFIEGTYETAITADLANEALDAIEREGKIDPRFAAETEAAYAIGEELLTAEGVDVEAGANTVLAAQARGWREAGHEPFLFYREGGRLEVLT